MKLRVVYFVGLVGMLASWIVGPSTADPALWKTVCVASFVIMTGAQILKTRLWWFRYCGVVLEIGGLSNLAVVLANGHFMPVLGMIEHRARGIWVPMMPDTLFAVLGDRLDVGIGLVSIGDVFLVAGVVGLIVGNIWVAARGLAAWIARQRRTRRSVATQWAASRVTMRPWPSGRWEEQ